MQPGAATSRGSTRYPPSGGALRVVAVRDTTAEWLFVLASSRGRSDARRLNPLMGDVEGGAEWLFVLRIFFVFLALEKLKRKFTGRSDASSIG